MRKTLRLFCRRLQLAPRRLRDFRNVAEGFRARRVGRRTIVVSDADAAAATAAAGRCHSTGAKRRRRLVDGRVQSSQSGGHLSAWRRALPMDSAHRARSRPTSATSKRPPLPRGAIIPWRRITWQAGAGLTSPITIPWRIVHAQRARANDSAGNLLVTWC